MRAKATDKPGGPPVTATSVAADFPKRHAALAATVIAPPAPIRGIGQGIAEDSAGLNSVN
jgi:hypothetical protein